MKSFCKIFKFTLLFLAATYTASIAQTMWTKDTLNNPVLTRGPADSWEDYMIYPHGILFDGSTYQMWYGGHDGTNVRIGYATSQNGISWEKYEANPVLDVGASGAWDSRWVYRPTYL